jgi:hypothetical protein
MPIFSNTPNTRPSRSKRDDLFNGSTVVRETIPRWATILSSLAANTSGTEYLYAVDCYQGDVFSAISFVNSTQPVAGTGSPTGYFALRDNTGALLAYTADTSSSWTGWTAATELNVALTKDAAAGTITSYTIPADGVYYLCCMIFLGTGGTALAMRGNTYGSSRHANGYASAAGQKKLAATGGTSLTSATPPATATLSFGITTVAYGFAH